MSRPKGTAPPMVQHALRMSADAWQRAEALVSWLSSQRGANGSTSDVLREALMRGLASLERDAKSGQ